MRMKLVSSAVLTLVFSCFVWGVSGCWFANPNARHTARRSVSEQSFEPITLTEVTYGEIILSMAKPRNDFIGAELVTIAIDRATIKVLNTGELVSAKTNGYFSCREFGRHGLQLRWVSPERKMIGVERFGGY